jgi:NDP-sugar pyrophosphorylase family protein
MKDELDNILSRLLSDLYTPMPTEPVSDTDLAAFLSSSICVLPCGGESKRMAGLSDKHKTALSLPDGETIISRTIRLYASSGLKKFILLVGVNAESVIESTKHLQQSGVEINYCPDPGKPVGRGGAILNAIQQGFISRETNAIIHNADDQIVGYPGNFLADICRAHIKHQKAGGWVTAVVALSTRYAYTGMQVSNGRVINISATPMIPVPTHIGVTIMSPDVYPRFAELFNLTEKKDFEGFLFPILAKERRLFAFGIPGNCWYPVNNPKEYDNLIKVLQTHS